MTAPRLPKPPTDEANMRGPPEGLTMVTVDRSDLPGRRKVGVVAPTKVLTGTIIAAATNQYRVLWEEKDDL
jgi:hypothetical protein